MDTSKIFFLAAAAAAVLLVLFLFLGSRRHSPYKAKPILTKREYSFYRILKREADARQLLICPKVGLKDLMDVTNRRHFFRYFGKISQKHVDFVICDRNLNVLFAVELDDRSHDTEDARKRDRFKDNAFRAAKIPLKRIRYFNEENVRDLFD